MSFSERFVSMEDVGTGAMAKVSKATDVSLGRQVAIKQPLNEEDAERFWAEAQATGRLEHANIPPLYEAGRDEQGHPYLALKLVKGQTLGALIARLNEGEAELHERFRFLNRLAVFEKVCEAVDYAHQQAVFHRDIKPDNIMVGEFGEVFLLDWGLSKMDGAPGSDLGGFSGTPAYCAPEIIRGAESSVLSEIYSLGSTLYEWMTLRPAYAGTDLVKVLNAVLKDRPVEAFRLSHKHQDNVPIELSRVIMKAMSHRAEDRYQSVAELRGAVRDILDGEIRPVCPCTTVKYGFHEIVRQIDNYPILSALVLFWMVYPLLHWVYLGWRAFHP
ncbi:MAG: serine/threonine-protein kinase [Vulcanimicrobiota bacterium]